MENVLLALLTDKAARKPSQLKKIALGQEVMEPWATVA